MRLQIYIFSNIIYLKTNEHTFTQSEEALAKFTFVEVLVHASRDPSERLL